MIAGYPGETVEDFEEMKNWVQESRSDRLGIFTYSHEENTHAYSLEDNISDDVKRERCAEIMAIQQTISSEINEEKIGKTFKVLFDRKEGGYFVGRTEFDSPEVDNEVLLEAKDNYVRIGDFAEIKITEASDFDLFGIPSK